MNIHVLVDAGLNLLGKKIKKGISLITRSDITLRNNEIKHIIKVIKFSENRGILLKRTTRKITSQEGLGLLAGISAADATIQNKIYGSFRPSDVASRTTALIISNEEMDDIMKIVKPLKESRLLAKEIELKTI